MADLTENMTALAEAIRRHPTQVQTALLGFDLWLEVLSSSHVSSREFTPGGIPATGQEAETTLKVPVPVLGKRIVIAFDASLPPDQFLLRP